MTDQTPAYPVRTIAECNALLTAPGAKFELEKVEINGVVFDTYKNAPKTLREIVEESRTYVEGREFIVYQDERVTFRGHYKAISHLAKALIETCGVVAGDRVAVCARNFPQWTPSFFAPICIGAIATPLNSWWTADELEYGLTDSGAKVAILDPQRFDQIRDRLDAMPDLKHVIIMRGGEGESDPRVTSLETLIGEPNSWENLPDLDLPAAELHAEMDATILYTSGTTGKPKGAVATHRACITNLFHSTACQARTFLRKGEAPPVPDKTGEQKIVLMSIPLFHATGCYAYMISSLLRADKLVTTYKWDVVEALQIIEKEKITTFGGVPAIAWQLLEHPDRNKYDLSSIAVVTYGGAPAAPELVSTIKRQFAAADPSMGWGMTETCATATLNFGKEYEIRPASAGAPGPASEIRIVDADGKALPAGGVGEMWYKGANNARCYWNKPEASAKTFVDGWVVTGDIAKVDEEGFLYILDRAKDMLIRGGENIYCIEVESVLYDHPAVMDAGIVGIPHKVLGEEVGAVVQIAPGEHVTEVELKAFCKKNMAGYKVPVQIILQDEPLVRNANGKILKNELRALFTPRD